MMHSEVSSTGQSAQEAGKPKPMDLDSTKGTPYTADSSFSIYAVVLDSYPHIFFFSFLLSPQSYDAILGFESMSLHVFPLVVKLRSWNWAYWYSLES